MSARERWKLGLVLASTAFNQDEVTRQVASQISSTEEALDLDLVFSAGHGDVPGPGRATLQRAGSVHGLDPQALQGRDQLPRGRRRHRQGPPGCRLQGD